LAVIVTHRCGNGGAPASPATHTIASTTGFASLTSIASLTPPASVLPLLLELPKIDPSAGDPLELPEPPEVLDPLPPELLVLPPSSGGAELPG
jgi:hypothetical protein